MNNYQDYRRILKSDWLWAVLTSELHKGQWMVPSNWTVNPTARVPLNVFQLFFFTASKKLTIILCTNIESGLPVVGCCFRTLRLRRIFIAKSNKGVVGLHIKNTVAPFLSYQDVIELSPHLRGPVSERPPLSHSFLKPGVGREQIVIYDEVQQIP